MKIANSSENATFDNAATKPRHQSVQVDRCTALLIPTGSPITVPFSPSAQPIDAAKALTVRIPAVCSESNEPETAAPRELRVVVIQHQSVSAQQPFRTKQVPNERVRVAVVGSDVTVVDEHRRSRSLSPALRVISRRLSTHVLALHQRAPPGPRARARERSPHVR